eukprot:1160374-Pelagomonas_calceolata.AAC.11
MVNSQCSMLNCNAPQCSAMYHSAVQCSAVQCTAQCNAMYHSAVQCTAQCNAMYHSAVQCAAQCSAMNHSNTPQGTPARRGWPAQRLRTWQSSTEPFPSSMTQDNMVAEQVSAWRNLHIRHPNDFWCTSHSCNC